MRRRTFLKAAGVSTAATLVPRAVLGGADQTPPSDRLNIGGIGVGGVGHPFINACAEKNPIIALCDVDDQYADHTYKRYPQARRYRHYQEMLDREDGLDAVLVATPDHTHAVITMAAIRKGRHVCTVKPLTRTVWEARQLAQAAREHKVATQMTAASNADSQSCRVCEWVWDGAIGDVHEVHAWSNRPLWPQGMMRPEGSDPVPDHLDWDLWIGPAPMRPFKARWPDGHLVLEQQLNSGAGPAVYHPWNFRGWWDFGTGSLGDMGCHHFNVVMRALKLTHPTRVYASSTKVLEETAPLASMVTWEFAAREGMGPVRLLWYDGGLKPPRPRELEAGRAWPDEGTLLVGDRGKLLISWGSTRLIPESKMKAYKQPPPTLPRRENIWEEWFDAIRGGPAASCNFDVAAPLTEWVLLGNIAIRTGKELAWDGQAMTFTNAPEGNTLLKEPYREGWAL